MRSLKREIIEEICVAVFVVLVTLLLWRWSIVVKVLLMAGSAALFVLLKLPISIPLVYGVIGILVYHVSTVGSRRLERYA